MYTLKVNIRAQEEREKRKREQLAKEAIAKLPTSTNVPTRKRKGLNFHEPGTFVAQAEQLRKKAKLEELQRKIASRAAKTGIADAVKLAILTTSKSETKATTNGLNETKQDQPEEEVPDFEWWDKELLQNRTLDEVILRLDKGMNRIEEIFDNIDNQIEHPAARKPSNTVDTNLAIQTPIFLTKKERKKLRKQNRKNIEMEKQEQIKLGLLAKPEPKLKRSNIMYALGNEAIVNPSMAEQMVKEQEEKRKQAHLEHNESKKLSLEEKRLKKLRKVQENLSVTGTWTSVYRILDMSSQAHKFKVTQNAKQLTMTGVLIVYKNINLVVVEGGPKQQRKFKHLMMDRIHWSEESTTTNDDERKANGVSQSAQTLGLVNKCFLVWEGQVNQRSFRGFKIKQMNSEAEARAFFQQQKVEHYWDLAFKISILESIEET